MYKVGELFAGIGGIGIGFKNAGFNITWANEIDKKAVVTYKKNFSHNIYNVDMQELNPSTLEGIDILTGGFPCQPFSVAGYRKGFLDNRGNLFFDIMRYIEILKPRVVFLENVKNLSTHNKGNTFKVIQESLKKEGYFIKSAILNTARYSEIPQNRERIYIICFKEQDAYNRFQFPDPVNNRKNIKNFLESNVKEDFYYTKSIYYNKIKEEMKNPDSIYQWRRVYLRENKNNLCPTLTANMGMGGHNVPLILDKKDIRKLTPRECARLQGFPDTYIFPAELPNSTLYKQIGNSVSVPVVENIAKNILSALKG